MKFRAEYVIPMVILVIVVIVSLCDSCMYFMPYDPEGYDNINIPLASTDTAFAQVTPVGSIRSASAPVQTTNGKKEGFDLLVNSSAQYGPEVPLDVFSQDQGDLSCEANPYSNSKGYLCMDNHQKRALQTRGFNQTGGDMQIGQATM